MITTDLVLSDNHLSGYDAKDLLGELAGRFPEHAMEVIGARMLDPKWRNRFFWVKFPFLATLPIEVVK